MNTAPIIIQGNTTWLPPSIQKAPKPIRFLFRFSKAERKIFRKRKRIPVHKWCEQHRYVTMSTLPGKWKNEVTPYLADIMDASFFQSVQTVIICKAPQVGGSEAVNNCIGYAIDRDPGPVLYVFPDELTARENSQDRIQPMIGSSPRLRSYKTGYEDDSAILRINLQHMPIYMAWARSAARLANKSIRYLVFDETDKYPVTAGKREADPISLGEARTTTYNWNKKIWKISTPTTEDAPIWKALTIEAQVVFDYWVCCPLCGETQLMNFKQIKWPKEEKRDPEEKSHSIDPELIEAENLAWYECEHCDGKWDDSMRDRAVRNGRWQDRKSGEGMMAYLKKNQPRKIGFYIPSWLSYFVPLAKIAAAFLRGLSDLEKFKDFKNKHEAVPWRQIILSTSEEKVLQARCDLPPQTVPEDAVGLTCGVDVQKRGFWFIVRAWAIDYTSWMIHDGFLGTWEDVEHLLFETAYPKANSDRSMRIFRAAVDTGGGKKEGGISMTEETYWWLRKNATGRGCRVWGTKGSSRPLAGKLNIGKALERTPSGQPIPGGLRIILIDTMKAKDAYHYHLQRAVEKLPQGAYLHKDTGRDYASQILAEEKETNQKGAEEWVQKRADNHLFDCECLAMCCADPEWPGGGIHLFGQTGRSEKKTRRVISKGAL